MDKNEIKKALYKQQPKAKLEMITKSGILYSCHIKELSPVFFLIPFNDIGDAQFEIEMEAKLLIRYLIQQYDNKL